MPQIKAAKKALKSSLRRRTVNDRWRRLVREALHTFRDAIKADNAEATKQAHIKAQSIIDRAARHHIMHRNKAAHQVSQLQRAVAQIKKSA